MKLKYVYVLLIILIFLEVFLIINYFNIKKININNKKINITNKIETTTKYKKNITNISITAVGDCTIGYDDNFGYDKSFNQVLELNGYDYFFSNVQSIFENDDITVANLEGTFTESSIKKEKKFNFKGEPEYVNVLTSGNIEAVNLANNHTHDYLEEGFLETKNVLSNANVNFFGNNDYYIYEKNNIKVGFAGIFCIEDRYCINKIDKSIKYFKDNNIDTIIISFHWGIEKSYIQSEIQVYLAHYAIDHGAELVLGHHPHVIQGIEFYNDKYILYSLGNFSFGGNKNPIDKDTMIFNINLEYLDNNLISKKVKVYPTSISSEKNINNYKPTLLEGKEYNRVVEKINKNSVNFSLKKISYD